MRIIFLLLVLLLGSCTVEQSQEERIREDVDREYERLSYAVGHYAGYLKNSADVMTPMSMEVELKKIYAEKGAKPTLNVSLKLGLFGGVSLSSTATAFDWGTSELIITFGKKEGASSSAGENGKPGTQTGFELRGHIVDGQISDGTMVGAHLGLRNFALKKGAPSNFSNTQDYAYEVKWVSTGKIKDTRAVLKLKTKPTTQAAPGTSDLAYLPGLEGSLEFNAFASAPQNAQATLYDPTAATLDVQFTDYSWFHATNVGLSPTDQTLVVPQGTLTLGGERLRELTLVPLKSAPKLASFPPATYLGTYQGSPESIAYKAVAYLNFLGGTANNTSDLAFARFPKMRMELDICNGDEVINQAVLKLTVLDFMSHKAVFHRLETEEDPLDIAYSNEWLKLDGTFLQVDQHTGGKQPKVILAPNAEVAKLGCAVNPK